MKMYEAAPGHWLVEGVTMAEHLEAVAGNYDPRDGFDECWYDDGMGPIHDPWAYDEMGLWVTIKGAEIPHADLTDRHLQNILALLKRHGVALDTFPKLQREVKRRGGWINIQEER